MIITKTFVSRKHYDNILNKLINDKKLKRIDAINWLDSKFVVTDNIKMFNPTLSRYRIVVSGRTCSNVLFTPLILSQINLI